MIGSASAFDLYADEYDGWFDTPEGRVLFKMEVEAVRLLSLRGKRPLHRAW